MMITARELVIFFPPIQGRRDILVERQSTDDIMREVCNAAIYFNKDYNRVPKKAFSSLRELWEFTKKTFTYREDSEHAQDLKSPTVMLMDAIDNAGTIDCKGYSLFLAGILNRLGYEWFFKFVSYSEDMEITHVYIVVVGLNGNDISILDCCQSRFDRESETTHYICVNPFKKNKKMAINRISGGQVKKRLNYNPSIYGRQRRYGQVGEGNNNNGKGGSGGGSGSGANKQAPDKSVPELQVPLPAPNIKIVTQPSDTSGTGSIMVQPDITMAASLLYPITFTYSADGKDSSNAIRDSGISLLTGQNYNNLAIGKYSCWYEVNINGNIIKSNVTKFVIKSPDSKIIKSVTTKNNPNNSTNVAKTTIFTPTNMLIGGVVIIGGIILMQKK